MTLQHRFCPPYGHMSSSLIRSVLFVDQTLPPSFLHLLPD